MMSFQGITISKGTFAAPVGPGPRGPIDSSFVTPDAGSDSARAEFTQPLTTAQRLRRIEFEKLGVTEESLRALAPDQRQALEAAVRESLAASAKVSATGPQPGMIADVKA